MATYTDFQPEPDDNTAAPPVGAPEGSYQGKWVNNTFRYLMAAVRNLGDNTPKIPGGGDPTLQVGTMAYQNAASVNISGGTIGSAVAGVVPIRGIVPYGGSVSQATALEPNWALCVRGDTLVSLADGSRRRIDEIVEGRQAVDVMAFNPGTGDVEPRRVVDWFKTEIDDRASWIILKTNGRHRGRRDIWVTPDHPVWIKDRGYVAARELRTGDTVLRHSQVLTASAQSAIRGMLMGDACMDKRGAFALSQGGDTRHQAYVAWVAGKLGANMIESARLANASGWSVAGSPSWRTRKIIRNEADALVDELAGKTGGEKYSALDEIGIAFWFADDGNLRNLNSANSWAAEFCAVSFDAQRVLRHFKDTFGWTAYAYKHSAYKERDDGTGYVIRLSAESSREFFQRITPYLHPAMRYKVPAEYRAAPFRLANDEWYSDELTEARIKVARPSKHTLAPAITRWRYDIKVDELSSFLANDFVVHNCDGRTVNGYTTPDLRGLFIRAWSASESPGSTGGSVADITTSSSGAHDHGGSTEGHALTLGQMPNHYHNEGSNAGGADKGAGVTSAFQNPTSSGYERPGDYGNQNDSWIWRTGSVGSNEEHDHDIASGGAHTHTVTPTRPPYHALVYIMRTT